MYDNLNAIQALIQACKNLEDMAELIDEKYKEALARNDYEVVEDDDPVVDWDAVHAKAKENREAKAKAEKEKEQQARR